MSQLRARYLDADEVNRLQDALDGQANQSTACAIRLLLLTGARRSEVLSATWDQFDLDGGVWVKPAASVKQKRLHRVPLSTLAVALLRQMRATNSERFLFPGTGPSGHVVDIKKGWRAVCRSAGIEGVRLHDLRHTYASHIVSAGSSLPVVGALLGHTQSSTTQRYAHLLDEPLRTATEAFAARIARADKDGH